MKNSILALTLSAFLSISLTLPAKAAITPDPAGDYIPAGRYVHYDILETRGTSDGLNAYLSILFDRNVVLTDMFTSAPYPSGMDALYTLCGFVGLDTDQNPATSSDFLMGVYNTNLGVDQEIEFCMFDIATHTLGLGINQAVQASVAGDTLNMTVPLAALNDDGLLDFTVTAGNSPWENFGQPDEQPCLIYDGLEITDYALGNTGGGAPAVPEPASVFLLCSGAVGLFGFKKRKS